MLFGASFDRRGSTASAAVEREPFSVEDFVWALGSFCALNRQPFDPDLLVRQFPPPYTADSLVHAARALGFRIKRKDCGPAQVGQLNLPCLAILKESSPAADARDAETADPARLRPAIVVRADADGLVVFEAGTNQPQTLSAEVWAERFAGTAYQLALKNAPVKDPDGAMGANRSFGFRWFVPELLKHKRVWRDVLVASLVIQLLALGTPLFTCQGQPNFPHRGKSNFPTRLRLSFVIE